MRILYFSDRYAHAVQGTKRSIMEEVRRREHTVIYQDKSLLPSILNCIKKYKPDQVWIVHSYFYIPIRIKKQIKIPVIGFGFSDPYNFDERKLEGIDVYITNHYDTHLKYWLKLPTLYNPTACDRTFHQNLGLEKTIDVSIIGVGKHPHFKNKKERIEIYKHLAHDTDFKIEVFGRLWDDTRIKHIEGAKFLEVINQSKIGLDIQDEHSPLAHRMMEYSACGIPVITRARPEVFRVFKDRDEIITYTSYENLKTKLAFYLDSPYELKRVGFNAQKRCEEEHDIRFRVDNILKFLDGYMKRRKSWAK